MMAMDLEKYNVKRYPPSWMLFRRDRSRHAPQLSNFRFRKFSTEAGARRTLRRIRNVKTAGRGPAQWSRAQSCVFDVQVVLLAEKTPILGMANVEKGPDAEDSVEVTLEELIQAHEECMETDETYLTSVFIESDASHSHAVDDSHHHPSVTSASGSGATLVNADREGFKTEIRITDNGTLVSSETHQEVDSSGDKDELERQRGG